MTNIDYYLDFVNDLYKILKINESVLYKDDKIFKDKYYRNRMVKVAIDFFDLPDDYVTVENQTIISKTSNMLHKNIIKYFIKIQKKHYGDEDKLGIGKDSNIITSFYEDTDHLCEIYTHLDPDSDRFKYWIANYSEEAVYLEGVDYKFYGGENERTVNFTV